MKIRLVTVLYIKKTVRDFAKNTSMWKWEKSHRGRIWTQKRKEIAKYGKIGKYIGSRILRYIIKREGRAAVEISDYIQELQNEIEKLRMEIYD